MKFAQLALDRAEGAILGHNVSGPDGRRRLRKGRRLSADDLALLTELGVSQVWAARLESGDVGEDEAAEHIARAVGGGGVERAAARTGRVNFRASRNGLFEVSAERLARLHGTPGVALATLPRHAVVEAGRMVATLKILPYALPEAAVEAAASEVDLIAVRPFTGRRVALLVVAGRAAGERVAAGFERSLAARCRVLGSSLERRPLVALEDGLQGLEAALGGALDDGVEVLLIAGQTAIQDREDLIPRAIEGAGGVVELFGAPVDPGNLLLLAYRGPAAIVGAPGCARSPRLNIIDRVLPRLLVGDRLRAEEVAAWGCGGLLEDVPERPMPRHRSG